MALTADARAARDQQLLALLARVGLGDRVAFAELYRLTSAHLMAVILRIQQDRAVAEDLLQDLYVNVWRAASSFDGQRGAPMTWLIGIARNRAIDSLRRRRSDPLAQSNAAPTAADGASDSDPLDRLPSEGDSPLQLLQRSAEARAVHHCMASLSHQQRQCLALAYYQGCSHAEVSSQLAQPLGTVKSWMRRALLALRDCLGQAAGLTSGRH